MITRMDVVSDQPDLDDLPLGGFMPNTEAIQIADIQGLGPVKGEMSSTSYATARGELYQGMNIPKRNIVLTLGLNPNWTDQSMGSLRRALYLYFMPDNWVTLKFVSDEYPTVSIRGVVESFEPNMFSSDPEIQISILCPKPDFVDTHETELTGTIEAGTPEATIDYDGTIDTGIKVQVKASASISEYVGDITIRNTVRGNDEDFLVQDVTVNFSSFLEVNTVPTQRYAHKVNSEDGSYIMILSKVVKNPDWPMLLPGQNVISILTDDDGLHWTLSYFNRYGGL